MKQFDYLVHLMRFAVTVNPLLTLAIALSLLSICFELASISSFLPLARLASGEEIDEGGFLVRLLRSIEVTPSARSFLICFAGLFLLRLLTQILGEGISLKLGRKIHAQLSSQAFDSIVRRLPIAELEGKSVGYFISLAGDESFRASNLIIVMSQLISVSFLGVLYYFAILYYSPWIALAVLVFVMINLLSLYSAFRKSRTLGARQVEQSQAAGSLFLDALNSLRGVRAFTSERHVVEQYRGKIFEYVRTLFLIDMVNLVSRLIPAVILACGLLIFVMVGWPSMGNRLDVAVLLTTMALLMRFFPVAGQAVNLSLVLVSDARAGRDVTQMIISDLAQESGGILDGPVREIVVDRVEFSYEEDKPVLRNVTMEFVKGNSYTILGPSGTGKSTLLDLLLSFHALRSGEIRINGTPVHTLSSSDLRRHILLVGQQQVVFNDTVANNISFGANVSDDAIVQAAKLACIHDVIESLPNGYEAQLSYRGTNLSGGQLQRIGLARALVRRPDVLILDESTSALDPETRDQVVRNILTEFEERIVVFVTHDRFVAKEVDVVYDLAALNAVGSTASRPPASLLVHNPV